MPTRVYGASGGGMGNKGYPTADVTGIVLRSLSGLKAGIRWTDPDDTVLDNAVLSDWASTIIVRKDGSVPESIKDGVTIIENTVHNQYQETEYIDQNGLEGGHTYYYRFFTKSASGVIGDGSPTVKMTAKAISPVLAENDWATIIEVAEAGAAAQTWTIGQEKDITLKNGETMTMQIWAFDRFDKADGTGKASMVLGTKHLMRDEKEPTIASWEDTPADCLQDVALWIDTILPDEISPHVKLVTAHTGEQGHDIVTQNKTLIPAAGELNIYHGIASCQAELPAFPIFTDNNSRIKKFANGTGETGEYFTRTVERPTMSGPEFVSVSELGDQWHVYQGFSAGVCFFFNI